MLIAITIFVAVPGLITRQFRGWRLTWQPLERVLPRNQFRIADILLWTTLTAVGLAAIRFLATIEDGFRGQIFELTVIAATAFAATACGFIAAFASGRHARIYACAMAGTLALGALNALPDCYAAITQLGLAYSVFAEVGRQLMWQETLPITAAVGTAMNCLVLRSLGCRLVRPGEVFAANT